MCSNAPSVEVLPKVDCGEEVVEVGRLRTGSADREAVDIREAPEGTLCPRDVTSGVAAACLSSTEILKQDQYPHSTSYLIE